MSNTVILKNAVVDGALTDVIVKNGKIIGVGKSCAEGETVDIGGKRLFAGLVDIHSHGCIGYDTMTATSSQLDEMRRFLKKEGTTTWFPTTMTAPIDDIAKVTSQSVSDMGGDGARIGGFHMEGPYISVKYKGAQNAEYIKAPDISEIHTLAGVSLITVAPELDGVDELIKYCKEKGIVACIGHTDCDEAQAMRAFEQGASCLTHTFNAMPPLLHRATGPVGAAILSDAYAQVICDGRHIDRAAIIALYRIFGVGRMILISDSMQATGLGDGEYIFGGLKVAVNDGVARCQDGRLAGSTATLFECVKKAIEFGIPEGDAFKMASETPARLLGLKKGRIAEGYDAEFIVVSDSGELVDTLIFN